MKAVASMLTFLSCLASVSLSAGAGPGPERSAWHEFNVVVCEINAALNGAGAGAPVEPMGLAQVETARASFAVIVVKMRRLECLVRTLGLEEVAERQRRRCAARASLREVHGIVLLLQGCGGDAEDLARILTALDSQAAAMRAAAPSAGRFLVAMRQRRERFEGLLDGLDEARARLLAECNEDSTSRASLAADGSAPAAPVNRTTL